MKIALVGAGALGGYMAAKLAAGSGDVVIVDRGDHQRAIRESGGITLIEPERSPTRVPIRARSLDELGQQDLVILGVKAMDLSSVVRRLDGAVADTTVFMTIQNGIPWWYFQRMGGDLEGTRLHSLDPDGVLERGIPSAQIMGCVAYPAADKPEPGVVRLISPGKFPVGEIDGSITPRVTEVHDLFESCGLPSRILEDIRSEIWLKALGSLSFNPISALTGSTMIELCRDPGTRSLIREMMAEGQAVGERLGATFRRTIEERMAGAEKVGGHKTSMLQSVERGERLEVDALISVISELGRLVSVPTPTIDVVGALAGHLDERLAAGTRPAAGHGEIPAERDRARGAA